MGHKRQKAAELGFDHMQLGCRDHVLTPLSRVTQMLLVSEVAPGNGNAVGTAITDVTARPSWFIPVNSAPLCFSWYVDHILSCLPWPFNLARTPSSNRCNYWPQGVKDCLVLGPLPTSVTWNKLLEAGVVESLLERKKTISSTFPCSSYLPKVWGFNSVFTQWRLPFLREHKNRTVSLTWISKSIIRCFKN